MKTLKTFLFLLLTFIAFSCSKSDNSPAASTAPQTNTLTFKGNPVTFNSLSIDDAAPNGTSEYIMSSLNNLSMSFYCKYINQAVQTDATGVVTYEADGVNYFPVSYYPNLTIRGYINSDGTLYNFISGQVKIKRNATGNQSIEFVNLKLKAGTDEQSLNGTINLPKI